MYNGGSDIGYWMSAPGSAYAGSITNEMAHLHYYTLGNRGACGAPKNENIDPILRIAPPFSFSRNA